MYVSKHAFVSPSGQVYVALPSLVPGLKRILEEGIHLQGFGTVGGQTYESNVPYILRYPPPPPPCSSD